MTEALTDVEKVEALADVGIGRKESGLNGVTETGFRSRYRRGNKRGVCSSRFQVNPSVLQGRTIYLEGLRKYT